MKELILFNSIEEMKPKRSAEVLPKDVHMRRQKAAEELKVLFSKSSPKP